MVQKCVLITANTRKRTGYQKRQEVVFIVKHSNRSNLLYKVAAGYLREKIAILEM